MVSCAVGGGVWLATGSPAAAGVTVAVGVVTDIDHLFDYYQLLIKRRPRRTYVLLHAWEYSFLGLLALGYFWGNSLLMAVVLGHLAHVASDHLYNGLPRFSYFITYRIAKGFMISRPHHHHEGSGRQYADHLNISGLLPFGRIFTPWLDRKFSSWIRERTERTLRDQYNTHHG